MTHFIQFIYFSGQVWMGLDILGVFLYHIILIFTFIDSCHLEQCIIFFFSTMETKSGNEPTCQMIPWRGK